MKDEFLAVLSHELRTPLNTVLGYARMLHREDARMTGETRERALRALERNAEILTRLVNDVLDTSRIITGKVLLSVEVCAVDRVIEHAIETIRPAAEAKGITIEKDLRHGLTVLGDHDRLQQVIWNLMSNAVKFTPAGGRIMVQAREAEPLIEISVGDSGIGIAAEDLPYVFQRFWQAQTGVTREVGGLGIGLALSRHLVELHGGTISVQSPGRGGGSVFTVSLPAAAPQLARAAAAADAE
jgi:signal transduction histidine kinase